jgi:NTP pyrophosphatase (non-canonical NTP hydrolase)
MRPDGAACSCVPVPDIPDSLTLDAYQVAAAKFDINAPTCGQLWYYGLGVAGEAGEVADAIKKLYRECKLDTESLDPAGDLDDDVKRGLIKEVGDVLWYAATIARMLGVRLSDVAEANIKKLESRLARGTMFGSGDNR